jgi:hypothetical protein
VVIRSSCWPNLRLQVCSVRSGGTPLRTEGPHAFVWEFPWLEPSEGGVSEVTVCSPLKVRNFNNYARLDPMHGAETSLCSSEGAVGLRYRRKLPAKLRQKLGGESAPSPDITGEP